MVFFSCGNCGESLKKNQVEKHYMTKCRNCNVLSCIDCQKDFWGEDYKQHIKCISEEEKYSGKNYKPKPGANKGEAKQDAWIHQVQQAIQKAPNNPRLKAVLERMEEYSNIPRKKAKFENFVTNSMRVWDKNLVSQVWELISAEMNKAPVKENDKSAEDPAPSAEVTLSEKQSSENGDVKDNESEKKLSKREKKELRRQQQDKQEKKDKKTEPKNENGEEEEVSKKKKKKSKNKENETELENESKKKKKKKRKRDEDESEEESDETVETPKKKLKKGERSETEDVNEDEEEPEVVKAKFKWEAAIIGTLLAADDNTLSIKKLRKKVMAEYASRESGFEKSEEKLLAKFNKKISKNPRLKVHKDRVKLLR